MKTSRVASYQGASLRHVHVPPYTILTRYTFQDIAYYIPPTKKNVNEAFNRHIQTSPIHCCERWETKKQTGFVGAKGWALGVAGRVAGLDHAIYRTSPEDACGLKADLAPSASFPPRFCTTHAACSSHFFLRRRGVWKVKEHPPFYINIISKQETRTW